MSGPDPSSIIREFRERPESYRQASEKEGEVWGETFSNAQKKILFDEDRQAADRLRPTRGLGLRAVLRERNLTFESGLSLACGAGRAEREFLRQGICKRFQGIDISDRAIEEARRLAADLPLTYEVADLNHVTLAQNSYDLVTTSSCLHHVLELEHLAEQIWRSLRPGGYLWIHDYVGETQFQYSDRRLAVSIDYWPHCRSAIADSGSAVAKSWTRSTGLFPVSSFRHSRRSGQPRSCQCSHAGSISSFATNRTLSWR